MTDDHIEAARAAKKAGPVFLEYGFRPFFLAAGLQAALAMAAWIGWIFLLRIDFLPDELSIAVPVHVWHAHEMIFGFGLAVVAGFFLTAVPNWTGRQPVRGPTLGILFGLWLVARLASWGSAYLPPLAVALPELAFIAMLAALVGIALLKGWSKRNFLFLPVLVAIFAAALMYHLGYAYPAHILGLDTLLITIAVIGGRVVPAFTTNALRREGVTPLPRAANRRDAAAIVAIVVMTILDQAAPGSLLVGWTTLLAGLLVAARMIGWRSTKVLASPILWVLHLAYGWLALGLLVKGIALTTGAMNEIASIHALTIGAVGSMTLAMMSRAALGHTGRDLRVSRPIVLSYILVSLAAVIRIAGAAIPVDIYEESVLLSGAVWIGAFAIFAFTYWPILTRPRLRLADS